jgi:TIP41-like family
MPALVIAAGTFALKLDAARVCRTYTTDYAGDLRQPGGATSSAAAPAFQDTSAQMDRELLMERAPILFSAHVPLYESEMDDHGVSACSVRVRLCHPCRAHVAHRAARQNWHMCGAVFQACVMLCCALCCASASNLMQRPACIMPATTTAAACSCA